MQDDDQLTRLNQKLAQFKKPAPNTDPSPSAEGINAGARAGLELVTSVIAGAAIGYGLDRWLGTRPWMLILFLFLGVGAGFMSVYRISNNLGSAVGFAALQKAQKTATKPPEFSDDEDD